MSTSSDIYLSLCLSLLFSRCVSPTGHLKQFQSRVGYFFSLSQEDHHACDWLWNAPATGPAEEKCCTRRMRRAGHYRWVLSSRRFQDTGEIYENRPVKGMTSVLEMPQSVSPDWRWFWCTSLSSLFHTSPLIWPELLPLFHLFSCHTGLNLPPGIFFHSSVSVSLWWFELFHSNLAVALLFLEDLQRS